MAANLDDVVGQLEGLNESILELLESGQRTQRMNEVGGYTPGQKSFILGNLKDFVMNPITSVLEGMGHQRDLGFKMVQQLDSLEKNNIGSGRDIKKVIDELKEEGDVSNFQLGGILDNARMQMVSETKGINLRGVSNKLLRNQLTLLEANGVQGSFLIEYSKNLAIRGFSPTQVRAALEHLTSIDFNSIQNAQGTSKMLAALDPSMTMLNIQNVGVGLHQMMRDLAENADPEYQKQAGEFLSFVLAPKTDDLALWSALGLDKVSQDLVKISKGLEGEDPDSPKFIEGQNQIRAILLESANRLENISKQQFGEYNAAKNAILMTDRNWSAKIVDMTNSTNGLIAAFQMDQQVKETKAGEFGTPGDIYTRTAEEAFKNFGTNLEITAQRFDERLLESSEKYARSATEMGTRLLDKWGEVQEGWIMKLPQGFQNLVNAAAEKVGTEFGPGTRLGIYGMTQQYMAAQKDVNKQQIENEKKIVAVLNRLGFQLPVTTPPTKTPPVNPRNPSLGHQQGGPPPH